MKAFRLLQAGALFSALSISSVFADSISPEVYSDTLDLGESVTITKTVTVSEVPSASAPVDVFFLADSTGSMGTYLHAIRTSMSTILTSTAGLGDVNWGVGEYKDETDVFSYRTNTDLTSDTAAVQTGINAVSAAGGDDWPEANMYALEQVAETVSWRDSSTRILVWFGDAPGHDPRLGSTEASATSALQAANIAVHAIDTGNDFDGLDSTGQAQRVADATGGAYYGGINSGSIVSTITDAVTTAVTTYNTVSLDLSDAPAGVGVSCVATGATADAGACSHTGSWSRDVDRDFTFDLTFTGVAVGDYKFVIDGLVDGGVVATEYDAISVRDDSLSPVPLPGAVWLFGSVLAGFVGFRRAKKTS